MGTEEEVDKFSGACHKRFRTEEQAKAFIEDWKESFAEVCRREIKKELDKGLRPKDMKLSVASILQETGKGSDEATEETDISTEFKKKLKFEEE